MAAATLTELGVTSIMAMALKGWVFHQLEAELTTFQLMRSPTSELLELIATHRKSETGVWNSPSPSPLPQPSPQPFSQPETLTRTPTPTPTPTRTRTRTRTPTRTPTPTR